MVGIDTHSVMDVESCGSDGSESKTLPMAPDFEDDLFSNEEGKCCGAVLRLKSSLIGSNKQKHHVIERGVLPRLIHILDDVHASPGLRIAVAQTLGSVAKGMDSHLKAVIDCNAVPVLLNGLGASSSPQLVESCLRCLKTLFSHPEAPVAHLYSDPSVFGHLMKLMPLSASNQIFVCTLLTHACKNDEHQNVLASHGAVSAVCDILDSPQAYVQLPALRFLAFLVFANENVAAMVSEASTKSGSLLDLILTFLERDRPSEMQLEAARCLTYLYRCGQLREDDPRITYKALPCVIRLTREQESVETRILSAETLAYLIELSAELQRIAAISNHLIPLTASFLRWKPDVSGFPSFVSPADLQNETCKASNGGENANGECFNLQVEKFPGLTRYQSLQLSKKLEQQANYCRGLKRAAFQVFGALAANDEDIRKRIIETDKLMSCLVMALQESSDVKLQMAAIRCLHSLSRSVQLLRTSFQDYPVWKPLMKILSSTGAGANVEFMVVASSSLCNMLLEFSPSKEPILESGAIDMLCQLTHKYEPALVLNGVWGLMNMAFRADQLIKVQIITTLGSDQIFRLLSDQDVQVVMKTLGLLRNLLSNRTEIDHVMTLYGKQVMQAVVFILEGDNSVEVKEQALCILGNIADGDAAKSFIMSNEDVLKKITNYMIHTNSKLQMAAVVCVYNLSFAEEPAASDRQNKLREIGVYGILQQLRQTSTDNTLTEKVIGALQQFT